MRLIAPLLLALCPPLLAAERPVALAIHGGAGPMSREALSSEQDTVMDQLDDISEDELEHLGDLELD